MAVPKTNTRPSAQVPQDDARQAPENAPKKPQDNTAAKQAPKETRSAVNNTFGKIPPNENAKQPDKAAKSSNAKQAADTPKTPVNIPGAPAKRNLVIENPAAAEAKNPPATEPKTAQAAGTTPSAPADPRVQGVLDTRLPDGKSVREKIDSDATNYVVKAARDHYNAQKDKGEAFDAVSSWYQNSAAKIIAEKGIPEAKVTPERIKDVFDLDKISQNIAAAAKDPAFAKWVTEQQANSVQNTIDSNADIAALVAPYLQEGENGVNALRRMQSEYLSSQDFADSVAKAKSPEEGTELIAEGMKTLAALGLGEKETLGVANTLAENIRSKYTPDAPRPVIDPNTNKAIQTEDGNNLAILPDGTNIALDSKGKVVADEHGNAYVYYQDGSYKLDANGKYIQYDASAKAIYADYDGIKYMLGPDRKGRYDAQGRPLAIDSGAPVARGKDGKAVTDKAGNKLVFDPVSGKAITDPKSGNAVVIDPATKAIVQADASGKVIAGQNGDPYAVDQKTGKFVTDQNGLYVRISKDNIAPGILPGYVTDKNNAKVVVNSATGKAMVDPSSGKTVILDPKTNAPQLVPLDANGAPRLTTDGKGIILDESGNTVVPNEGKGPNWLVDASGNYAQDGNGSYIGVHSELGLAAPVDQNGFVKNGNGLVPLWDTKTHAPMTAKDGNVVVADNDGNLLLANDKGETIVEEKTALPYLFDPATQDKRVNPDNGRAILLDKSGLPVEYNADDGYKYLINPETGTTVKTAGGNAVTTDDNGVPYAVRQDGSAVKNPDTGNFTVYGPDGLPAVESSTGYPIEITPSGKAHVIDPKTGESMAERDPKTGGFQLFNKDGTDVVNPDTGNKVQMVPDSRLKVEIDPKTNKPVANIKGNPLVLGADDKPLKTPDGLEVVADLISGQPIAVDANGKAALDPVSKLPLVVDTASGVPMADPDTKAAVVIDPKSRQPAQVDAGGKIVIDPVTQMPVAINAKTGAQVKTPDGARAVNDPQTGLPVVYDRQSKLFTVVVRDTGKAVTDPKTGATAVLDVDSGLTFNVLPDAQGNSIIVDENGKPAKDANGNQPWFDKATGALVVVNGKGEVVNVTTGKTPETMDPKDLAYTAPLLMTMPAIAMMAGGKTKADGLPTGDGDSIYEDPPYKIDDGAGTSADPDAILPSKEPWMDPNYRMTAEERDAFKQIWKLDFAEKGFTASYEYFAVIVKTKVRNNPKLSALTEEELVAVASYTAGPWWRKANKAMYTKPINDAELKKMEIYLKAMRSGLNGLQEAGFAYKGTSRRELDLTPAQFQELFGGETYTNLQFMSTTPNTNAIDDYAHMNTTLKINHLSGVDIHSLARYTHHNEVLGVPGKTYAISNFSPAGSKRFPRLGFLPFKTKKNKATLNELPPDFGQLWGGNPDIALPSSNWSKIGKALGKAGIAADAIFGGVQVVMGGMEIAEGVKNKDDYGIASGSLNLGSGVLALGATGAALAGGAAAAAVLPLTGAAAVAGMVALIVDILKHQDDHTNFASNLGDQFGPFGVLKDGWREKAAQAYYDSQGEPDPAPIAHGNNP